ncbi:MULTISPECIES: hemerythrin domain-containing protein [unclassified Actinomadura]|uniref:hemerythrin domain-containing protein n=1 Tax=unclassified Actinomadura TaxID=2626254 RepID=UPI0011EEAA06|nr:hemerythrin domain-containing protein [Actinomadura sp. K4S16]
MSEGQNRLIAWNRELAAAHQRLRQALHLARRALDAGDSAEAASAGSDLLLYCKGFCAALEGHHLSEDAALFPELAARHPELRPVITKLQQDHELIASLLTQFDHALSTGGPPDVLASHLDGLAAIMESHFRYEERQLLDTLAALELDVDPRTLLGPL